MTAEPDLLPLRDWMECLGEINAEDIRDYARANVEHAVAPLQAEVEALRAEVEMLRDAFSDEDMTAGAHWFGRYVEQKRRAERLAEALRHQRWCRTCAEDGWESCEEGRKNDALLRDQEEGR